MPNTSPIKLRYWFYGGFAVVFLAMLFLYHVMARHPSGKFVVSQSLGRFYVETFPLITGVVPIGPIYDNLGNLPMVLLVHLFLSLVGGLFALAVGMFMQWTRKVSQ